MTTANAENSSQPGEPAPVAPPAASTAREGIMVMLLVDASGRHRDAAPARLPGGMKSGASSVTIRVDLPDGRVVLVETSLKMLGTVARAFEAADAGDAERAAASAKGQG